MAEESFKDKAIKAFDYDARHNITENGVITVTITLAEYRKLVAECAKAEQSKNDLENWQLRQEIEHLKQQILDMTLGNDEE